MRHHPSRLFAALVRFTCRAALRAAVTCLIFAACLIVALACLGVPLTDFYEMLDRFEGVSRLAEVLS